MPNWKTLESKDRLLAALVAAHSDKKLLDYRRIATYYGQGTTYDSIEGQFRLIRKEAQKLRSAVDSGEQAPAPHRNNPAKAKLTKKNHNAGLRKPPPALGTVAGGGVISGRIVKSNSPPSMRMNIAKTTAANTGNVDAVLNRAHSPVITAVHSTTIGENRIHGVKDEAFSTDDSVIEIETDNFIHGFDDVITGHSDAFDSGEWNISFSDI